MFARWPLRSIRAIATLTAIPTTITIAMGAGAAIGCAAGYPEAETVIPEHDKDLDEDLETGPPPDLDDINNTNKIDDTNSEPKKGQGNGAKPKPDKGEPLAAHSGV